MRLDMEVGSQIKSAREELGIKQPEMAERLNVSLSTVQKWEQNLRRPSYVMLQRIGSMTDKPVAFFFEDGKDAA